MLARKILLFFVTISLSEIGFAKKNDIYFRLETGAGILSKLNRTADIVSPLSGKSIASNYATTAQLEAGLGCYFNRIFHGDISVNYMHKFTPSFNYNQPINQSQPGRQLNEKIKTSITSYFVNGYVDLISADRVKIFAGGGIGLGVINETIKATLLEQNNQSSTSFFSSTITSGGNITNTSSRSNSSTITNNTKNFAFSSKERNFAYNLQLGASLKLSANLDIYGKYSFSDLGESKLHSSKEQIFGQDFGKYRYLIHSTSVGIKFYL